jgi:proteasome accessory factor C
VPRLSTRQAAAIASGLSYLESVLDDSDKAEIHKLRALLSDGSSTTSELPFKVHPSAVDTEVSLSRQAISEDKLISCSYINAASQVSIREIEPICIESNDSIWYLRGYCRTKLEVRIFRLDRMREISLSTEKLVRSQYVAADRSLLYSVGDKDTDVVFDVDPEGFGLLADYKPDYPVMGDKTLRVTISIGDISTLGRVVSKYSGHVRVVAPEQARRVVFEYASNVLGSSTTRENVE